MKKIFNLLVSFCLTLCVLSLFSGVYYNKPIADKQPEKITNYKYLGNRFWSQMEEGFGFGVTDRQGYNNISYDEDKNPDIIFIGSSHLEALQVPSNANFVHLLNKKLLEDDRNDNNYKCLNLGVSGHFFKTSISNFEYVLEKYGSFKYLFIETSSVLYDVEEIDKMIQGKYHEDLKDNGFIYSSVQKIPYFRFLYKKIQDTNKKGGTTTEEVVKNNSIIEYSKKMTELLNKFSTVCRSNNVEPIILLHSRINLEGDFEEQIDKEYFDVFKRCCVEAGVDVLDVTQRFISEYTNTNKLPYGFMNTTPGSGHLNKYGHEIIAEELYNKINKKGETAEDGI